MVNIGIHVDHVFRRSRVTYSSYPFSIGLEYSRAGIGPISRYVCVSCDVQQWAETRTYKSASAGLGRLD
jgi:hypothetical protein